MGGQSLALLNLVHLPGKLRQFACLHRDFAGLVGNELSRERGEVEPLVLGKVGELLQRVALNHLVVVKQRRAVGGLDVQG